MKRPSVQIPENRPESPSEWGQTWGEKVRENLTVHAGCFREEMGDQQSMLIPAVSFDKMESLREPILDKGTARFPRACNREESIVRGTRFNDKPPIQILNVNSCCYGSSLVQLIISSPTLLNALSEHKRCENCRGELVLSVQ